MIHADDVILALSKSGSSELVELLPRLEALGFQSLAEPRSLVMVARAFHPEVDPHKLEDRVYVTMADSDLE